MSHLTVYRASAGSGKTFTLATEYIKRLIIDPHAYRNILAVTFTNKATAEMKERILSQLYGISVGDVGSKAYLEKVMDETHKSETEVRHQAHQALSCILHDYSRFHVETIDTFSVSVMRNLAKELGVGANINIDLNAEDALSDAVDTLIENLQEDDQVLRWLSDYIQDNVEEGKQWRIFDNLKTFGHQIFDETFIDKGEELQRELSDFHRVEDFKNTLYALRRQTQQELLRVADEYIHSADTIKPLVTYFTKIKAHDFSPTWNKTLEDNRDLPCLVETQRLRHVYYSCQLSLLHLSDLRLLTKIDEGMNQLNKQNSRFLLANINKLLHEFIRQDDTPFVLEKVGATINTVMMDEFQDTSRLQWQNFRPLLLNGLSQGCDSLIVGDVKQSIYRWRHGDWTILNSELRDSIESFPIVAEELTTNRRSARTIIEFNNTLFPAARDVLNASLQARYGTVSDIITTAYADVCQEFNDLTPRGYVRVEFLPDPYRDLTFQRLEESLRVLKERGVADKDIAILVRKGKDIKRIAEYFATTPYRLVSDEAFQLNASVAVNIIIDALRYLSLPNISASEQKLLLAPLAIAYQQHICCGANHQWVGHNAILLSSTEEILSQYLPDAFTTHTSELSVVPLYELTERLYDIFSLHMLKDEESYVYAFLDAVTEYLDNHSSSLTAFVSYWEETLSTKTIPVGEVDGIRILTIHKSKGLEFHSVLVPFCDWNLEVENRQNPPNVWCAPSSKPYDGLSLLPIEYKKDMDTSIYSKDYRNEQLQMWVDNLNLLYVAFTRAKENLFVWSKQPSTSTLEKIAKIGDKALENLSAIPLLLHRALRLSSASVYEQGALLQVREHAQHTETNILLRKPTTLPMEFRRVAPKFTFRESNDSAAFINGSEEEPNKYIDRGNLLHDLFAEVRTRSDVPMAVNSFLNRGLLSSPSRATLLLEFINRTLDNFIHADWFDGSWQVFNECSIIYEKDRRPEKRRPDRVMLRDGQVVVLDYKFGRPHEGYHEQVFQYMSLLHDMGYTNIKGYLWYVLSNQLEEVPYE